MVNDSFKYYWKCVMSSLHVLCYRCWFSLYHLPWGCISPSHLTIMGYHVLPHVDYTRSWHTGLFIFCVITPKKILRNCFSLLFEEPYICRLSFPKHRRLEKQALFWVSILIIIDSGFLFARGGGEGVVLKDHCSKGEVKLKAKECGKI